MTMSELRLLPPLAFARVGSAKEPQDNYHLQVNENDPLGFRRIMPTDTLTVANDGTLRVRKADASKRELFDLNKIFRDGDKIRPVAPFFELFAIANSDQHQLEPVTPQQLGKHDRIEWRVQVENRKVFRRTGDECDIVRANTG